MIIPKRNRSAPLVVAAAALAIGASAGTAQAAATLTVTVSGGGHITGTSPKAVIGTRHAYLTCTSSTVSALAPNGSTEGGPSVKIGTIAGLSFRGCSPVGPVTVTVNGLPYGLQADSKTDGAGKTDVRVPGVSISVSMIGCSFTESGSAPGYFTNGTHQLALTSKLPVTPLEKSQLTLGNVNGCAGLLHNGDHAIYQATYPIGHLVITSS